MIFIPLEKTNEDAAKAEVAGAWGLEDEEVLSDAEDVSTFLHFAFHFVLIK